MNLESFLDELRAAREAGVVFMLDRDMIRVRAPGADPPRCPLEVVCARVVNQSVRYFAVSGLIEMEHLLACDIVLAADNRSGTDPALRARLLEACGLAPEDARP